MMLSVADAVARVAEAFAPLPAETVSLESCLGRVLAEDLAARLTHPPADVSAMDGYAVRAEDIRQVPATLRLIGQAAAGAPFAGTVAMGEAVRIFTGALLPAGADAIVIQEHSDAEDRRVIVLQPAAPGRYIRREGQDFRKGEVLLQAGRRLTAREVGLAAAMNVPWLAVRRRPRVAVLATGDELAMPGEPLAADQIASSASLAVAAFLAEFGAQAVMLGIARDTTESLAAKVAAARGCDLLLSIGGASVGDFDLVRGLFNTDPAALDFYRVAMRPGKPLLFGRIGELPILGLPGNPVSACVTALLFARPAVRVMLGLPAFETLPTAVLGCALDGNDQRQDYLRARLTRNAAGLLVATPFAKQDSALLRLLAEADCLVVRPPHAVPAQAGEPVQIVPLASPAPGF